MRVLILSCNTGQGHNSAGSAVREALEAAGAECELLDALSFARGNTSKTVGGAYASVTTKAPSLFGGLYQLGGLISNPWLKSPVYLANTRYAGALGDYIEKSGFDAVVCPHLFPAETLTCLRRKGRLSVKTYAVATDYTCIPFWEETELDAYFVPHEDLKLEFAGKGLPQEKLIPTGIPISRRCLQKTPKAEARRLLGLPEQEKVFLVMTGSMGFGDISSFALDLLLSCPKNSRILILTGRNAALKDRIDHDFSREKRVQTVAFTRNAPLYMDACDILLSKPGGLTSTEAAVQNIPLVHTRPIPGCETANARFFVSHGLSVCAVHPKAAALAAASLAEDTAALQRMTECQKREINPNAAEEIAAIILSGDVPSNNGTKN